jgi:hypothetical protein
MNITGVKKAKKRSKAPYARFGSPYTTQSVTYLWNVTLMAIIFGIWLND